LEPRLLSANWRMGSELMSSSDTLTSIANQALASIGNRSTIASLGEQSNEAIQVNLIINDVILELLRMAPWDCAFNYNLLQLITAAPGTPENPNFSPIQWNKTLPAPPWAYEYAYPSDCLRALWVVPQYMTGYASGVPITTAITGGAPSFWNGPPARFKVAIDQPVTVTGVTIVSGGSGYQVGDTINLGPTNGAGVFAVLKVSSVGLDFSPSDFDPDFAIGQGSITGVSIVLGGSYSIPPSTPTAGAGGSGSGALFNLTLSSATDQRVILTNQEFAILAYVKNTVATEPQIWDDQLVAAIIHRLGSRLVLALTGDKALANERIKHANELIIAARNTDANEGLTVNDITPDWIRIRGITSPGDFGWSPNMGFDWGQLLTMY
jgi:hypothetical protein